MKLLVETIDKNKLDVVVKGDRHEVIKTVVQAMELMPELREAVLLSAKEFLEKNRFKSF